MSKAPASARIALAVTVVTWAASFPAIRLALDAYSPAHAALLRYGIAAVVLAVYSALVRLRLPPWRDSLRIAGLGAIGIAAYNVLLIQGQKGVAAGSASFLVASVPIWMVVLAALFSRERPAAWTVGSMLVSFGGLALIAAARPGGVGLKLYALAVLASAVCGAIYSVFLRPYTARYGAAAVLAVAVWGALAALLPAAPGLVGAVRAAPVVPTLAVVFLALVPGVVGYAAWAYASARATAATAGMALYLVPVLAMVLSALILGEIPTAMSLVGGALVLLGVIAVNRRPVPRPAPAPAIPAVAAASGSAS